MSGAVCWICLDGGADDTGKPIVRDCACRGDDAGFAHTSCIIQYAQKKCEQTIIDSSEFTSPWLICPNCKQSYQNELSIHISDALVSFAKQKYDYPGNELEDKMKIMEAIRLQIQTNIDALRSGRDVTLAKDKIEKLIRKLLAMVDQLKEEHDMGGWSRLAPDTNRYICGFFEAFGYLNLGRITSVDQSQQSIKTAIDYFFRAREIYTLYGDESGAKHCTENIERVRAESEGDNGRSLKIQKNIYQNRLESAGKNAEGTICAGHNYALELLLANHSIKAERLLTKLAATSRQVYGENHNSCIKTVTLLKKCKMRLVILLADTNDGIYQALRYENGGEICIVTGPIEDEEYDEGRVFRVASAMVYPKPGCPVMCHGLINAPHLNGKLGEVRSFIEDSSSSCDGRFEVHFEEKGLKPAGVKLQNLRIAFELPSV